MAIFSEPEYMTTDYEERYRQTSIQIGVVARLCDVGEVPVTIPWTDPLFQKALLKKISAMREYKRRSDDLAVIERVFGGTK